MILRGRNVYNDEGDQKPLYTLQQGEQLAFFREVAIIVHPEREPFIIRPDGRIEILRPLP